MRGVLRAVAVIGFSLVALLAVGFYVRLRTLGRRVGSFECALQTPTGWASGVAHYGQEQLSWYRIISLSPRPAEVWHRAAIEVQDRIHREGADGPSGIVDVTCEVAGRTVVMAMRTSSYSGFASWLESAPPRERIA